MKDIFTFLIIWIILVIFAAWIGGGFGSSYESPPDAYIEHPESSIF